MVLGTDQGAEEHLAPAAPTSHSPTRAWGQIDEATAPAAQPTAPWAWPDLPQGMLRLKCIFAG